MIIRPATTADVPAITEIANALVESTTIEWMESLHTLDDRVAWLAHHQRLGEPVLVAVDDDVVVGWAAYGDFRDSVKWPGYRFTVEHSIHVAESHWGRGVGRSLMVALIAQARRAGKRVMVAAIDAANTGSVAFHSRLGFIEVGRMPLVGDKWGQRLSLVLMQLELDQPLE